MSKARIARITTRLLRLPLRSTLKWGRASELDELEHVLVRVEADGGAVGIAEAPVRPTIYGETVASITGIIEHYLAPRLLGLPVTAGDAVAAALASVANNHTARGSLDIAIQEAAAVAAGSTLLAVAVGPNRHLRVSYILGITSLKEALAEVRAVIERGVTVFKVKVGRDSKQDARLLGALQHEFGGSEVMIYADANQLFVPEDAIGRLEQLAHLGIHYVEEPLPIELISARHALRRANVLPIIADDSCFTLAELKRELELDTFDILNIKPARTGFTTSRRMLELARSAGKGVMVGSQASSGLGTVHAAIFASHSGVTHPSELSFPLKLHEDSITPPLSFHRGVLAVSRLAACKLRSSWE